MTLLIVRNDPRTPLERALGVNPDTCRDRTLSPTEKQREAAIAALAQRGIKVLELPGGRWSVTPAYPANATDAMKAAIDAACEDWMRSVRNLQPKKASRSYGR